MTIADKSKTFPKVVIDARMVGEIPHGIARYVVELAQGLEKKQLPYQPIFLVDASLSQAALHEKFGKMATHRVKTPFLSPKELWELPRVLKEIDPQAYHSPSFSSLWNCPCPSIVTIHDLNHLTYGDWIKKLYYQVFLRRFASKAEALISVSEFSRKELADWLHLPMENIEIVYNSVDFVSRNSAAFDSQKILEKYQLQPKKYFFCLSNPKPHKNLALLVQAYQNFRKQNLQAWPLVLSVETYASSEGVQSTGSLPENEAKALLSHAGGMFFPSLYEGFGLPPLEAAILGVPLSVSRIPPHEEGLQDLAASEVSWVNPTDLHGWVRAFHQIQNGEIPPTTRERQQTLVQRFSTERMALRMDQIYRRVLRLPA